MEEHERIELRSDDVQEIIGTPPRWIVKWGTTVIALAIAAMISMSFFVAYPDKVYGRVTISTQTAPVRVKVPKTGNIAHLNIKNTEIVSKGQVILVMQDAAEYEDVSFLEKEIKPIQKSSKEELLGFDPDTEENLILGNLQLDYSKFLAALRDFQKTEEIGADQESIKQVSDKMNIKKRAIKNERNRLKLAKEKLKLKQNDYKRNKKLLPDGISQTELEKIYNQVLEAQLEINNINARILNAELEQSALGAQIKEIQNNSSKSDSDRFGTLRNSINNLVSAIGKWKEQNLVVSPMDGRVSIIGNWGEQAYVDQGTEIMTVLPEGADNKYFIQLLIPIRGSGKVEKGQTVLLKFDNFPYREYGSVEGIVESIAEIPSSKDKQLQIEISLPNELRTNSNKELPFSQEMEGNGEIITENKKVITRIFENVINPLRNE